MFKKNGIPTNEVSESTIREFLESCRFSHWHWGYQPIRTFTITSPDGTDHTVYDISGEGEHLMRWNDPRYQVRGWNAKVAEECLRPLLENGVLLQPEFGFQISASFFDWLKAYDELLWRGVHDAMTLQPAFAATYAQNILPAQPGRIAELLIEIGIRTYKSDFGKDPLGFWPAELAVTADTVTRLYASGIRVLILMEDQLDIPEKAPLYTLSVGEGGFVYVIPYSSEVSTRYGFQNNEAREYTEYLVAKQQRGLATGANDMETLGHHRGASSIEFAKWLYGVYLPASRQQGRLSWIRRLDDAKPVCLKPVSSWSCIHGIGRWTGDERCNCDGATIDTQREKARLHALLTDELNDVMVELDSITVHSSIRWEPVYVNWFLSQRSAIARGLPVQPPPGDPMGACFLRLMNATVGEQSCSFFFNGKFERGMAHSCVREMDSLHGNIPVAA